MLFRKGDKAVLIGAGPMNGLIVVIAEELGRHVGGSGRATYGYGVQLEGELGMWLVAERYVKPLSFAPRQASWATVQDITGWYYGKPCAWRKNSGLRELGWYKDLKDLKRRDKDV